MTEDPVAGLVRRIHATESPRTVVYATGGGTEVFPILLARGGGSATLLGARIPYAPADFHAILGSDPGKLADARAARALAMAAFRHALAIRGGLAAEEVFGVGATSKLSRGAGEREGRAHEVHVALQDSTRTVVRSIALPGGPDRDWEERINALSILNMIALGKGVDGQVALEAAGRPVGPSAIEERSAGLEDFRGHGIDGLLVGRIRWTAFDLDGNGPRPAPAEAPRLLLPGSFRPLHDGHVAMAEAASSLAGVPCDFEVSLTHPDKPPIDYLAIRSRLEGFAGRKARVYLTDAPTYLDKARLFPGCTFALGHDTALRIIDPKYYGGPEARDAVLAELEALGARFLVFGRVDAGGRFRDFSPDEFDGPVARFLGRAARPVPESVFRRDLSSTEVRDRAGGDFD